MGSREREEPAARGGGSANNNNDDDDDCISQRPLPLSASLLAQARSPEEGRRWIMKTLLEQIASQRRGLAHVNNNRPTKQFGQSEAATPAKVSAEDEVLRHSQGPR